MSIHYDVEAAVALIRQKAAEAQPKPGANPYSFIVHRNPDVRCALVRMVLTEQNRGTEIVDVVEAIAHLAAEPIGNMLQLFDEEGQEALIAFMIQSVTAKLFHIHAGTAGRKISFKTVYEEGGHA